MGGINKRLWCDDITGVQGYVTFYYDDRYQVNNNATGYNTITPSGFLAKQQLASFNFDDSNGNFNYAFDGSNTSGSIVGWTGPIDTNESANLGIMSAGNGAQYGEGKMQELVIYPNNQSSNRTGIEDNINDFYDIYYLPSDSDAQAFVSRVETAGGSLSNTEKEAVDTLVSDLKDAGIWTKMKAIYPMVGASAAACAQNLKSSSFTGTFNGGWTFASTGVQGNGSTGYMDTGFTPSSDYLDFNNGYSIYSRTNSTIQKWDFGTFPGFHVYLNYSSSLGCKAAIQSTDSNRTAFNDNDSSGFFTFVNNANNSRRAFRNGVFKNTNTSTDNSTRVNQNLYLASLNDRGNNYTYSNREYALLSMHDGLTDIRSI